MKKVYIIHGWATDSNMTWIKWLEKELSEKNIEVHALNMPNSRQPKIEEWVSYLKKNAKDLDEESFFVGHSVGCQTILRFLEKEPKGLKIGGCVFVAPWIDLVGLEGFSSQELTIAHPWLNSKIDFERVLEHTGKITCIFSTNDRFVSPDEWEKFEKGLEAKIIVKKDCRHFEKVDKIEEILHELK